MIDEGLSEIMGPFPVPPPRNKRERNDDPGQKKEATGTTVLCRPPSSEVRHFFLSILEFQERRRHATDDMSCKSRYGRRCSDV